MSLTLALAHFILMNGNRKSGLISLRKANKSGILFSAHFQTCKFRYDEWKKESQA